MTIKEVQELIEAWEDKNRSAQTADGQKLSAEELSDMFWKLFSLANHSGVDMTEALINNLEGRNTLSGGQHK